MRCRSTTNFRTGGFSTAQAFNVVFIEVDHWEGLYLVFIANFFELRTNRLEAFIGKSRNGHYH